MKWTKIEDGLPRIDDIVIAYIREGKSGNLTYEDSLAHVIYLGEEEGFCHEKDYTEVTGVEAWILEADVINDYKKWRKRHESPCSL